MKHIGVTQEQFDSTWNRLPDKKRFWAEEEDRFKAGFLCFVVGDVLVWSDYLLPPGQFSEEVALELEKV